MSPNKAQHGFSLKSQSFITVFLLAAAILTDPSRAATFLSSPAETSSSGSMSVFQDFQEWARTYTTTLNEGVRARMRAHGLALVRQRRIAMRELVRTDPQKAVVLSLASGGLRTNLPVEITRELETPLSEFGDLLVVGALQRINGPAVEPVQRFAKIGKQSYRVFSSRKRPVVATMRNVQIQGVAVDGFLALDDSCVMDGRAPRPMLVQTKRSLLIIRVDFSDLPGDPNGVYTAPRLQEIMDSQIVPFFLRSSYGTATLTYTIAPRLYRLPQTAADYAKCDVGYALIADARVAAGRDVRLADYDSIVVVFSWLGSLPGSQINYGGMGEIHGSCVWVNGEFDFRVVAHELGHNLGLFHANLWQVNDGNPISNTGFNLSYADDFDPMGVNRANDPRTDFNPWFKNRLGWIQDTQVQNVTTSGVYRVNCFDSGAASGILALKITKDGIRNYWIGCRRNFTNNPSMQHGACILWGYNFNQDSSLLDATTPGSNVQDAALAVGDTLTDQEAHITICPIAEGGEPPGEYMDINVTFGSPHPVVTQLPQSQLVTPGQTAVFNVRVVGNPLPSIHWQMGAADSMIWTNLSDGGHFQGSASSTLILADTTLSMGGAQFRCWITNSFGNLTSAPPAVLTVLPSGLTTLAGEPGVPGAVDGLARLARLRSPEGLAVDRAGNLFVADSLDSVIRKISPFGVVTTIAGVAGNSGNTDGFVHDARFHSPSGLAVDKQGNLYVADTENQTIRKIGPEGIVSTFAGQPGICGAEDGQKSNARFCYPVGLALDPEGNLYVSCQGSSTIRRISSEGLVITFAGVAGNPGSSDGLGAAARFMCPRGLTVDSERNLYVADQNNSTIRKITRAGLVSTLAGSPGLPGATDGPGGNARFNMPSGVAIDNRGTIYVADSGNSVIRAINAQGVVTTFAGNAGKTGIADGPPASARFDHPTGLILDQAGNLYIADTGNATMRKYAPLELHPPELFSNRCGSSLVFSWSGVWHGYALETKNSLDARVPWMCVSQTPLTVDGMNTLTNCILDAGEFFRLRRQ